MDKDVMVEIHCFVESSGGAPTPAGTSVFTKHNWDMEMGHLWLNGLGIYDSMGGASCCFVWKYAQKMLVFKAVPFPIV